MQVQPVFHTLADKVLKNIIPVSSTLPEIKFFKIFLTQSLAIFKRRINYGKKTTNLKINLLY